MKKTILPVLLTMALSCPVFADQKSDIQQKYDNEKKQTDQDYDQKVSEAKANYQGDDTKLHDVLNDLKTAHDNKINDLNNDEKVDLQKVS